MKHPLAGLVAHPGLHLALARRSWDDGEELRLQLEAALALPPEAITVVSSAPPDTAFGLAQRLVAHVAPGRVVRLPMDTVEWAERAAVQRCWNELPPPGVPGLNPELFGLAAELQRLLAQPDGPEPTVEWARELGDLLGFFHTVYQSEVPARWRPSARWEALPQVALVTGARGFLGRHLTTLLESQGFAVHPAGRAELATRETARELLERVRPARVFHLGAQSSVAASLEARRETLLGNVMSQRHLLEGLVGTGARVLVVGSSEEYGAPDALPLTEEAELKPRNIYAVSKVGQDLMGRQFFLDHGLHVVRVRSFNHTGPGRSERFMEASFAAQLARICRHEQEGVIRVGNLEARRDFSDGRDAVRAYALLLERGEPGEVYNVCSGVAHSAREVLDFLLRGSEHKVRVENDPERMRPSDIPESRGSYAKLAEATGWQPLIPLSTSLQQLYEERLRG